MKQTTQAPNLTHANAAAICHMALKTMGLRVHKTTDYREGYDFLVDDKVRIAVRYAIPTSDRQQVYRKRNGDLSHYSYKRWTFNFHRHGKKPERYCDFFVCFLGAPAPSRKQQAENEAMAAQAGVDTASEENSRNEMSPAASPSVQTVDEATEESTNVSVFVIPWEAITGLTFCSSMREGSTRPYRGKYAIYRDAWNLIGESGLDEAQQGAERKRLRISADSRRRLQLVVGPAAGVDEESAARPGIDPAPAGDSGTSPARRVSHLRAYAD